MNLNRLYEIPKPQLFWILQICGWLVYSFVFIWDNIFFNVDDNTPAEQTFLSFFIFGVTGLLMTLLLRAIYRRVEHLGILVLIGVSMIMCFVFGITWTVIKKLYIWYFIYPEVFQQWVSGEIRFVSIFFFYSNSFFIFVVWTAFYFSIKAHFTLIEQTKRLAAIQTDNEKSKFQLLRYQLNPHFLFNSLNAASNLALSGDGERTNEVLAKLSSFLRFSLDISPEDKMTVNHDIDVMKKYLQVENIRFGKRLKVDWDIDPQTGNILIPSFLIQPLIENSIKHAVSNNVHTTTITIATKMTEPDTFVIEVKDDGPLKTPVNLEACNGIGLKNVQERLKLFYGDNAKLNFSLNDPQGMHCQITIKQITRAESE